MRQLILALVAVAAAAPFCAGGTFRFRDVGSTSLELSEDGNPVFVYNYGMLLKEGVKEQYRRSTYLHPVYAPDGTVLTDDFPKDHPHHRGICWAWPVVRFEGQTFDVWAVQGMYQRFVRWISKQASQDQARLAVENGWFVGNRKAVKEIVEFVVHPAAGGRRAFDVTLTLEAVDKPVEIAGREKKGYGGFGMRFAPREDTVIRTDAGIEPKDSDLSVHPWAELEAVFAGHRAGARIEVSPDNPGAPNGWCLRHYGYLGVSWPGLQSWTLQRGKPLKLKYRVTLFSSGGVSSSSGR
jgi:hypothetical protein